MLALNRSIPTLRLLLLASLLCATGQPALAQFQLNEVMVDNRRLVADEDGDFPPWIEVVNKSAVPQNIARYGLTTDPDQRFSWTFPSMIVPAGGHAIVFASGKDRRGPPDAPARLPESNPGFQPANVTGLLWWVDATDTATLQLSGDRVSGWLDKSGRTFSTSSGTAHYDAVAATVPEQPVLQHDPLTGLPAVHFDGERHLLKFPVITNIRTAFWVVREPLDAGDSFRPLLGSSVDAYFGRDYDRLLFVQPHATWVDGVAVNPNTTRLPRGRVSIAAVTAAPGRADSLARTQNLPDVRWAGDMMEVILYDRALTTAEREKVQNYLQRKWLLPSQNLHTGFVLDAGEAVYLTAPDGTHLDTAPPVVQAGEIARGRVAGSTLWQWFDDPTPGVPNTTAASPSGLTPDPVPFPPAGPFTNSVTVTFATNGVPGAVVYYTTDGSDPSDQAYTKPIKLTTNTVLRAQLRAPGRVPSQIVTATYYITPPGGVAVVSIATAPANLYSPETGIYVDGAAGSEFRPNYQRDWERGAHVEFFEPDGSRGFSTDCGLKIHGSFSRGFAQRSLRVHFRDEYGTGELNYPVFPDSAVHRFDSIILRNFGNDWNIACMRDALGQALAGELGLDTQAWRPAHVFINGAYQGLHEIRERPDVDYLASHHDGGTGDFDMLRNSFEVVAGDRSAFNSTLAEFQKMNVSDDTSFATGTAHLDLNNFADWLATELYTDNSDWPNNNMLMWRHRSPDARWKWAMIDLDSTFNGWGFGVDTNSVKRIFTDLPTTGSLSVPLGFIRTLMLNTAYRRTFSSRFADLLNSTFSEANVSNHIEQIHASLAPAMPLQVSRWGSFSNGTYSLPTVAAWERNVDVLRDFAARRPGFIRQHLVTQFQLGGVARLSLAATRPEGVRSLRVNTLQLPAPGQPWSGVYFKAVPVQVVVEPARGWRLAGWNGSAATTTNVSITLTNDQTLTAVLVPDESQVAHDLSLAPFRFLAWDPAAPAGIYPEALIFQQTTNKDPGLAVQLEGIWSEAYNLKSKSRLQGLGDNGISFLNTSDPSDNGGYLGSAVLTLKATASRNIRVSWTGGTVDPNNRPYALRLQWRAGTSGEFIDVLDPAQNPVEYVRSATKGDARTLGPVTLPAGANRQPLVQLRWKYYAIPTALSGGRAELRLDDIEVAADAATSGLAGVVSPTLLSLRPAGAGLVLEAVAEPGSTAALYTSTNLIDWLPAQQVTAGADGLLRFTPDTGADSARFFQMRSE